MPATYPAPYPGTRYSDSRAPQLILKRTGYTWSAGATMRPKIFVGGTISCCRGPHHTELSTAGGDQGGPSETEIRDRRCNLLRESLDNVFYVLASRVVLSSFHALCGFPGSTLLHSSCSPVFFRASESTPRN
eukprot:3912703-Rhodomonas_salina.3